ncbi:hypothetical protein KCU92_g2898, partial [Aureobasidium melanogenum]|jgi:hypothetical protein
MAPSPPTTFRLRDLPSEIFKLVLNNVDKSDLPAIRSTCKILKEETDDHFHVAFFTEIECDLSQRKLEKLVWLSKQSQLACHIKTLLFSIHDNYTARSIHRLVDVVINNLSFFSSSLTLGVASQQWNHSSVYRHCGEMTEFLKNRLVSCTNAIDASTWKVVARIGDIRLGRDYVNLHDCFGSFEEFVGSQLNRNVTTTQNIEIEIHEGAGDPVRYVKVTKNPALQAHAILENFNCDRFDANNHNYSLSDAVFMESWRFNSLTVRDSIVLRQTSRFAVNRNPSLRHLVLEDVRLRRFDIEFPEIVPSDWIDTLQMLRLDNLESCRLVNLYDGNGDLFIEGVWEFTATPYRSVGDAIAGLVENVQRARSIRDEAEAQ